MCYNFRYYMRVKGKKMNTTLPKLNLTKTHFKSKLTYILTDKAAIFTFIIIYLKNILFMNVLSTNGAASLSLKIDNIYLYPLSALFFVLFLISFSFLAGKRLHLLLLVLTNLFFSVALVGDLWYYRGFHDFLNFHLLGEMSNLNNLSSSVLSMSRPIDLIFLADNLILIILGLLFRNYYKKYTKEKWSFAIIFCFSFFIIMLAHISLDYHGKNYHGPEFFKTQWIPYSTMRNLSPIGYHIFDTVMFLEDNIPYQMSSSDKAKITEWFNYKNEGLPDNKYKSIFAGKNLILIQVESLENFPLNNSINGEQITPNLNKLLKNSLYFSNYYEQVNTGTSADADLMTNTSIYPVRRGSTFFRFPNNQYNTLSNMLAQKGYGSKALHSDYGYYWNVEKALINFGFGEFKDMQSFDTSDTFWMGITDESFFKQIDDLAVKQKNPFYYFAVTSTSHSPFKMPDKFKSLNLDKDFDNTYMGGYLQSVSYADKQIGKFIDNLDKQGILDNTVVVIYGDHNGVHKYYSDEVAKITPNQPWWDNGGRIPLIIYSKELQGENIKTIGGQVDLLPTIAYTLGIDEYKYKNTTMGRNLLNTKKSFALLNNGTIIGKENLSVEDISHVNDSFEVADKIIRSNYFK